MIDFSTLQGLTIPEGVVTKIEDASGRVLWSAEKPSPIILEVAKQSITSYAGETSYSDNCILLDIYPKSANSTVNVTYGGLTKTLEFSGTNAKQVYFGTFNGVADETEAPASGTLTIEGGCVGFAVGAYQNGSKTTNKGYCGCITAVTDWGGVTQIPDYAFRNCKSLTSLHIPEGVTNINLSNTFYGCSSLVSLALPTKCSETTADGTFVGCSSLVNLTLPEGVTSITSDAFGSVTDRCTSLLSLHIPASVVDIQTGTYGVLYGCPSLENIEVDNKNDYYSTDGCALFNKDKTELIGFAKGSGDYSIPSSVTTIANYAFYEISGSATITVPMSVTSIGNHAFYKSSGAYREHIDVVMLATIPPQLGSSVFNTSVGSDSTTLYYNKIVVPIGCSETYKTAEGWNDYASRIVEAS